MRSLRASLPLTLCLALVSMASMGAWAEETTDDLPRSGSSEELPPPTPVLEWRDADRKGRDTPPPVPTAWAEETTDDLPRSGSSEELPPPTPVLEWRDADRKGRDTPPPVPTLTREGDHVRVDEEASSDPIPTDERLAAVPAYLEDDVGGGGKEDAGRHQPLTEEPLTEEDVIPPIVQAFSREDLIQAPTNKWGAIQGPQVDKRAETALLALGIDGEINLEAESSDVDTRSDDDEGSDDTLASSDSLASAEEGYLEKAKKLAKQGRGMAKTIGSAAFAHGKQAYDAHYDESLETVDDLLMKGKHLYREERWLPAKQTFEQAKMKHMGKVSSFRLFKLYAPEGLPRLGEILWWLGNAEKELGEYDSAIKHLERISNCGTAAEAPASLLNVAYLHFYKGSLEKAAKVMVDKALHHKVNKTPMTLAFLANIFNGLKKYRPSARAASDSLHMSEQSEQKPVPQALYFLGLAQVAMGRFPRAKKIFSDLFSVNRSAAEFGRGTMHYEQGDFSLSAQYFKASIKSAEKRGQVMKGPLVYLARMSHEQGHLTKAMGYVRRGQAIGQSKELRVMEAEINVSWGYHDKAAKIYYELLSDDEENIPGLVGFAKCKYQVLSGLPEMMRSGSSVPARYKDLLKVSPESEMKKARGIAGVGSGRTDLQSLAAESVFHVVNGYLDINDLKRAKNILEKPGIVALLSRFARYSKLIAKLNTVENQMRYIAFLAQNRDDNRTIQIHKAFGHTDKAMEEVEKVIKAFENDKKGTSVDDLLKKTGKAAKEANTKYHWALSNKAIMLSEAGQPMDAIAALTTLIDSLVKANTQQSLELEVAARLTRASIYFTGAKLYTQAQDDLDLIIKNKHRSVVVLDAARQQRANVLLAKGEKTAAFEELAEVSQSRYYQNKSHRRELASLLVYMAGIGAMIKSEEVPKLYALALKNDHDNQAAGYHVAMAALESLWKLRSEAALLEAKKVVKILDRMKPTPLSVTYELKGLISVIFPVRPIDRKSERLARGLQYLNTAIDSNTASPLAWRLRAQIKFVIGPSHEAFADFTKYFAMEKIEESTDEEGLHMMAILAVARKSRSNPAVDRLVELEADFPDLNILAAKAAFYKAKARISTEAYAETWAKVLGFVRAAKTDDNLLKMMGCEAVKHVVCDERRPDVLPDGEDAVLQATKTMETIVLDPENTTKWRNAQVAFGHELLSELYFCKDRFEEANRQLDISLSKKSTADKVFRSAEMNVAAGELSTAIKQYKSGLEELNKTPRTTEKARGERTVDLANVLKEKGEDTDIPPEEAARAMKEALALFEQLDYSIRRSGARMGEAYMTEYFKGQVERALNEGNRVKAGEASEYLSIFAKSEENSLLHAEVISDIPGQAGRALLIMKGAVAKLNIHTEAYFRGHVCMLATLCRIKMDQNGIQAMEHIKSHVVKLLEHREFSRGKTSELTSDDWSAYKVLGDALHVLSGTKHDDMIVQKQAIEAYGMAAALCEIPSSTPPPKCLEIRINKGYLAHRQAAMLQRMGSEEATAMFEEALVDLKKAKSMEGGDRDLTVARTLASVQLVLGKEEDLVEETLPQWKAIASGDPQALVDLGTMYGNLDKPAQAARCLVLATMILEGRHDRHKKAIGGNPLEERFDSYSNKLSHKLKEFSQRMETAGGSGSDSITMPMPQSLPAPPPGSISDSDRHLTGKEILATQVREVFDYEEDSSSDPDSNGFSGSPFSI